MVVSPWQTGSSVGPETYLFIKGGRSVNIHPLHSLLS